MNNTERGENRNPLITSELAEALVNHTSCLRYLSHLLYARAP